MRKMAVTLAMAALGFTALVVLAPSDAGTVKMTLTHTDVSAPPETIFALVEDFRNWTAWSPHESPGKKMRRTYGGAAKGKGAFYEWDGGNGAGRAQIIDASAPATVVVDLTIVRPTPGHVLLKFAFAGMNGKTEARVTASGPTETVGTVVDGIFGGSLFRLSCAAGGVPERFCGIVMKKSASIP